MTIAVEWDVKPQNESFEPWVLADKIRSLVLAHISLFDPRHVISYNMVF